MTNVLTSAVTRVAAAVGRISLASVVKELESILAHQQHIISITRGDHNPQVVALSTKATILEDFIGTLLTSISTGNVQSLRHYKD